ncbi:thioredoxin family protein [Candidatus Woesearchaeota archaeon]|nr:thioredoxin family protein [Candidatus Woesearchaeota archaeon]
MKNSVKVLVLLAALSVFVYGCSGNSGANQDNKVSGQAVAEESGHMDMMAEEGFEMINGKMMMVNAKENTQSPMESDMVLNDGSKVMTDGKVIRPDGSEIVLKEGESIWMDGSFMEAGEMMEGMMDDEMMEESSLKLFAGKASKYYRYDKASFEKSLKEGKTIFLDFHANWCPTCKAERPGILAAFNELDKENVVGYQVHFNDDETNADDKEMAKKYGITVQHTKVIINSKGNVGLKTLEVLSKQEIINRITKIAGE